MPDKTHAINMIRKSVGDPILEIDKVRIHDTALLVLGKKHVETECPFCIEQKLKGGVAVEKVKVVEKGSVSITHEPNTNKKTIEFNDGEKLDAKSADDTVKEKPVDTFAAPAEKSVDEDANGEAAPVSATPTKPEGDSAKLDRIIALLESALGGEEGGEEVAAQEEMGYEEEAPAVEAEEIVEGEEERVPPIKVEDEDEEPAIVNVKPVEEEEEDLTCKGAKARTVTKIGKVLLSKKLRAVIEPLVKENAALKARLEKIEKQPLPRKDAAVTKDGKPVKVEKYQDVMLEKKDSTFSETLTKDIETAKNLRMTKGVNLTKEEDAFCQRVANDMLAEKLSK